MIRAAIFFLSTLAALSARAELTELERSTGVLRVSTEYETGKSLTGTGVLIFRKARAPEERDHTFLFTCAHLTGGSNVRIAGIPLEKIAIGRRTDNFRDLELVEIDHRKLPAKIFARHTPSAEPTGAYRKQYITSYQKEFGLTEAEAIGVMAQESFYVDEAALAAWKKQPNSTLDVEGNRARPSFALMPPWSARGEAEKFSSNRQNQIQFSKADSRTSGVSGLNITKTFVAPARIAPGMSCAPLLDPQQVSGSKYQHKMKGLGTEFRAQMASSTFSSMKLWSEAMASYLQGDLKQDVPAQWASHDGLLYLKIGEKSAEIIPLKPAGNGVTVDPGNGVTVDPGKFAHVSKGEACNPRVLDSQSPWEKAGTVPGIIWEGNETLGFSMEFRKGSRALIFPDRAGIEFRLSNEDVAASVDNIPVATPVLGWLNDRFGTHSRQYRLEIGDMYVPIRTPVVERHGDQLDITLYGPLPESERIRFSLNEYGALTTNSGSSAKELNPLVEIKGDRGNVFIVDLTDLFFVQAKSIGGFWQSEVIFNKELAKAHPETVLKKKLEQLQWKLSGDHFTRGLVPGLSFRKKCTEEEIRLNFENIHPLEEEDNVCQATHLPSPIPSAFLRDARYFNYKLTNPGFDK